MQRLAAIFKNEKSRSVFLITVISVFLTAGLLCCIFLWWVPAANNRAFQKQIREYYNQKVKIFAEENKTASDVDVVFLGDSITDGYPVAEAFPEFNVLNRGIGGDTAAGLEARLQVSAYDVAPKAVVLLIGCNDLGNMEEPYRRIAQGLRDNLPETKLIFLTYHALEGFFDTNDPRLVRANEFIAETAAEFDALLVDLHPLFLDPETGEIKDGLTSDGVHPNEAGYALFTPVISEALHSLLDS